MEEDIFFEGNKLKHLSGNPFLIPIVRKFNNDVAELASSCKPKNILDIGCGEGFTTITIADKLPNARITAIDFEREYTAYAKEKNKRENVTYECRDLFNLPFRSNEFDLVICNEVLEHIKNYEEALNILTSISSKSLVVSVPNEPWFRIANLLRLRHISRLGNVPGHVNRWSKNQIRDVVSAHGRIVTLKTSTFWNIAILDVS